MCYITVEMVSKALKSMKIFHDAQVDLHERFGISFTENLCRRNNIMSVAQERFFAREIASQFSGVTVDGRTGMSDIFIGELGRELECKMTSPELSSGEIRLQTDYKTLVRKGEVDHLYVIVSPEFDKFCVLYFDRLTPHDFREPCASSRGKASMIKTRGMQKCTVLWGRAETQIEKSIDQLELEIQNCKMRLREELVDIEQRLKRIQESLEQDVDPLTGDTLSAKRRRSVRQMRDRLLKKPARITQETARRIQKIQDRIEETRTRVPRFSYILHPL